MYGVGLLDDCIPPNTILVFPRGEVIENIGINEPSNL
jgi:hypothetical protein